jgi:hypothetical protein
LKDSRASWFENLTMRTESSDIEVGSVLILRVSKDEALEG